MIEFFKEYNFLFISVYSLIQPFFGIKFIIKSIKNKKLSNTHIKNLIINLIFAIIFNIIPFYIESKEALKYQDENGDYMGVVIHIYFIILALISLFVIGLFYSLYYWVLNKNNNDIDNKRPLKIFGKWCLVFIVLIGIFKIYNFIDDNKRYIIAKTIDTEIIEVNSANEIPNLDGYFKYTIKENNNYDLYLNNKIVARGVSTIYYNDSITGTAYLEIDNYDDEDMYKYNKYTMYISYDEEIPEDSYIYVYGTIKDVKNNYDDLPTVMITPEKIYYIERKNLSED